MIYKTALFLSLIAASSAKTFFQEDFNDAKWADRWTVPSDWKPKVSIGLHIIIAKILVQPLLFSLIE